MEEARGQLLYWLLLEIARHPLTPKIVDMIDEIRRRKGFFSRKQVREYLEQKYGVDPAWLDIESLYRLLKRELEEKKKHETRRKGG